MNKWTRRFTWLEQKIDAEVSDAWTDRSVFIYMDRIKMKEEIKKRITNGQCMLLLGAGASYGSKDARGNNIPMGEQLSEKLCKTLNMPYQEGVLGKVYGVAKQELGASLVRLLEENFQHTRPSLALERLAGHIWPRIYTLNIDDATERALYKKSKQNLKIRTMNDPWSEVDSLFTRLDLVKLNGCINRPMDGFIFSPSEYASASNKSPEWYRQLGRDYLNYTFLFIGTKLDEPLFYQQIEYYKNAWAGTPGTPGKAYLITPNINEIDRRSLAASNIEHIAGTLEDLVNWLDDSFGTDRRPIDVALAKSPELAIESSENTLLEDFAKITKVEPTWTVAGDVDKGKTREFYLGFKPTWREVFDGVPASLDFHAQLKSSVSITDRIYVLTGPAGSGKSTALMMLAAELAKEDRPVYYLQEPVAYLENVVRQLEAVNDGKYYLFIDKASSVLDGIIATLNGANSKNVIFVCGERLNVWRRRTEWALAPFRPIQIRTEDITPADSARILKKLEIFGPWSKISKIPEKERRSLLVEKAKRQLLIGLLELTYGYGFERIIENDFEKLPTEEAKLFVIMVGLATVHNLALSRDACLAALSSLGVKTHIDKLLMETQGIIHQADQSLRARHPVYIDKLFDGKIKIDIKERSIRGLLLAMARHQKPVSKHMSRNELMLFKLTINHHFLKNYFHGKNDISLGIFKDFEKKFELDGLYYLQFGLCLRDMARHDDALRKLRSAVDSWAMKQTEHAYAHQLLICALHGSKENALRNLELSKEILLRLDAGHVEEDTDYPLVTLAEYHVEISKKFGDLSELQEVAKHYVAEISNRQRKGRTNVRLEEAKRELFKIAILPPSSRTSPTRGMQSRKRSSGQMHIRGHRPKKTA